MVAPPLAAAALVVLTASGCGGASVSSELNQAFHPSTPVHSGKVQLAFALAANGLAATSRQPVSITVGGPFEAQGSRQLPRFDLGVTLQSGGRSLTVGATHTGSQLFVKLQGVAYLAPDSVYQQFKQSYAQSQAANKNAAPQPSLASLGINPGAWLRSPKRAGSAQVGGTDTDHIVAALDAPTFLADLGRVSGAGNLGLGPGLSAAQRTAIGQSLKSSHVDVYVGKDDHILRRLTVQAALVAPPSASAALGGLKTGTLDLTLAFSDVNRPQAIPAPVNPQPFSKLSALIGAAAGGATGLAGPATPPASPTPAAPSGATGPTGAGASGQQAYLQCAQAAGQDVARLQRCAPLLSGG